MAVGAKVTLLIADSNSKVRLKNNNTTFFIISYIIKKPLQHWVV
jgi:hypothetical protein